MKSIKLTFNPTQPVWNNYAKEVEICIGGLLEHWELPVDVKKVTLELLDKPTKDTFPVKLVFNQIHHHVQVMGDEKRPHYHFIIDRAMRQLRRRGIEYDVTYHVRCMV